MAAQGRKNVHGKTGVRFKTGWTATREKAMQRNVVTELIIHEKVTVTSGVTKDLIKNIDHLITLAKKNDLHAHREAAKILRNEKGGDNVKAINKLFKVLGPRFKDRKGGYTHQYKMVERRGDGAKRVVVTFVE
ncbi:MAG: 50S ribosomal protein L17 [Bacilli bacterium]|nr:50S ribosomal protein L17 [Bacilli bacterium]